MSRYILSRVLWTIPILILTMLMTVGLVRALPGEPFSNPKLSETTRETLRERYGYDDSVPEQVVKLIRGLPTFDFGISTQAAGLSARDLVSQRVGDTLLLGFAAFTFSALLGGAAGIVSATAAGTWRDWTLLLVTTAFFAIPTFVTSIYWITYLPYGWGELRSTSWWLPIGGLLLLLVGVLVPADRVPRMARIGIVSLGGAVLVATAAYAGSGGADGWVGRIGPIAILSLAIMPYFTRLLRASMIEALQSDYITTARSKGISERRAVLNHALRNSLIPVVTNAGPLFAFVLTGSFIIEYIFNIPGIAGLFVSSFNESGNQGRDVAVIMALTILLSALIIIANMVVDIIVARLDPRITNA